MPAGSAARDTASGVGASAPGGQRCKSLAPMPWRFCGAGPAHLLAAITWTMS